MKLPRLAAARRWPRMKLPRMKLPRMTVRVRMTVLVGLAAALVLIPATVFGPNRVEQALLNDVFDDEAAAQAENIEPLVDLMRQPIAFGAVPAEQSAQTDGSPSQDIPVEVEIDGFSANDASYLRDEAGRIGEALGDLDRLGHLDGLLRITQSNRQSGVPVVLSNGSLAAFSLGDRSEARLLDPASVDSPVITVFGLNDLVYKVGGFEPPGFADKLSRAGVDNDADRAFHQIAFASRSVGGTDFVVAADVGNVTRSLDRIQSIMWLVTPLAVSAVVLVAWLLTGLALRPVERITEQVREINAGTLGERVPRPGSGDEIDRLAVTMKKRLGDIPTRYTLISWTR